MNPTTLRKARLEDRGELEALLEECGLSAIGLIDVLDGLLVAEGDGRLVGMAGIERYGDSVLVRSVAVRERNRSRGIGEALVSGLLDRARDLGASRAYLLTDTAERFFSALGFETVPRSHVPAAVLASPVVMMVCTEDCACMTLTL